MNFVVQLEDDIAGMRMKGSKVRFLGEFATDKLPKDLVMQTIDSEQFSGLLMGEPHQRLSVGFHLGLVGVAHEIEQFLERREGPRSDKVAIHQLHRSLHLVDHHRHVCH